MKKNLLHRVRPFRVLVALCLGFGLNQSFATGEVLIPLLKTASGDYRNVKIFNRTGTHLSFSHERGTAVIKVTELEAEALATLDQSSAGSLEAESSVPGAVVVTKPAPKPRAESAWLSQTKQVLGKLQLEAPPMEITRRQIWISLGAVFFLWWAYSLCVSLICRKAGKPGGALAWIPVLQIIPLFRAAGMSGWWFLAMFIPLLNLIGQLIWCVKITQARGKGFLTAVLLILPGTNLLAFLYLALSNGHAREEDTFVPIRPPHALAVN